MWHPTSLYPKANSNRISGRDPSVAALRYGFLSAALKNFLMLQFLFFALFAYIFGSLYKQTDHIYNLDVLFVDYDGGAVGAAVRSAYAELGGKGFPTNQERAADELVMGELRGEVCGAKYWAVLYTTPGATARLEAALSGLTASTYDPAEVMGFYWNEALYSPIVDAAIAQNLQILANAARVLWAANGTFGLVNPSNQDAVAVYGNPWKLQSINIQPTTQGSRLVYNTLVIILILIQEFFYLGTINSLYARFKLLAKLYPHRIILYRNMISLTYTLIGSLSVAGAIWAFRSSWNVNGTQFVLTWLTLWLFAHLNFLAMDTCTVWLDQGYVPMALITWIILNVTSILLPFQLSNGFYRWAYALPAHEVYQVLIDIWSGGCNPQLHVALPVLFTWEVLGLLCSGLGVYRRCHYAAIAEESQERTFSERVDAAMALERRLDEEREKKGREKEDGQADVSVDVDLERAGSGSALQRERTEIAEAIRVVDGKLMKEPSTADRRCNFDPAF